MAAELKSTFSNSLRVNPNDFLTDGETPEQAKKRITAIVSEVVKNGLNMCDGKLHFAVSEQDMTDAKAALGLLKDEDANYMRHANDSSLNAMGAFVSIFQISQMEPEKKQLPKNVKRRKEQYLSQMSSIIDNMHDNRMSDRFKKDHKSTQNIKLSQGA